MNLLLRYIVMNLHLIKLEMTLGDELVLIVDALSIQKSVCTLYNYISMVNYDVLAQMAYVGLVITAPLFLLLY